MVVVQAVAGSSPVAHPHEVPANRLLGEVSGRLARPPWVQYGSNSFLSTFEKWRREVLLEQDLVVVADLGHGVMEQAMVEAAA
jgi:hypothetical protein